MNVCKRPRMGSLSLQDHGPENRYLIGKLPDEVLCLIVSNLRLSDAVKSTSLSRRWLHLLPALRVFKFNWVNMFFRGNERDSTFWKSCREPCAQPWKDKFVRGVTQFLDFYQPPHMQSVEISFCLGRDHAHTIDGWVRFVVQRGIQNLKLCLHCFNICCNDVGNSTFMQIRDKYVFHSALLQGAKTNLRSLDLVGCVLDLGPNFSDQLCHLKVLSLTRVTLPQHVLETMLSCLVKLESLELNACQLPNELFLASLSLLETLAIRNCQGIRKIVLPSANLLDFQCATEGAVSFDLRGFDHLQKIHCTVHRTGWHGQLPELLPELRSVRFNIWRDINWVKCLPRNMNTFATVKRLSLKFFARTEFCFSVLRAFPCVWRLAIQPHCGYSFDHVRWVAADSYPPENLKEVIIRSCCPSRLDDFIVSLLRHAFTLKRLTIIRVYGCCRRRSPWDEGERRRIYELLQGISKNVTLLVR